MKAKQKQKGGVKIRRLQFCLNSGKEKKKNSGKGQRFRLPSRFQEILGHEGKGTVEGERKCIPLVFEDVGQGKGVPRSLNLKIKICSIIKETISVTKIKLQIALLFPVIHKFAQKALTSWNF